MLEGPLYAVGGHDGWSYLSSVERYDPETQAWTHVAAMSTPRSTLGVAVVGSRSVGRLGSSVLFSNQWRNFKFTPSPCRKHHTTSFVKLLHCALAAAQCIVIGPVCLFVAGCVCLFVCLFVCGWVGLLPANANSKLRASILTKLGL